MKIKILGMLLLVMSISGCFFDEPESDENVVLLEDVLFVASNKVRILARVHSSSAEVTDHGIEFSTSEDFINPIVSSLGTKGKPGKFIVQKDSLEQKTKYFYRAFIISENTLYYSETRTLSTFESSIKSFFPTFGNPGITVTIDGTNLTNNIKVFFGDVEAEILEVISDFRIRVKVPSAAGSPKVPIRVLLDEKEIVLNNFEYITGKWTEVLTTDFRVLDPAVLIQNDKLYLVGGQTAIGQPRDYYNAMDLDDYTWTSETVIGLPSAFGAFSTESGLIGGGALRIDRESESVFEYFMSNQLWAFDQGIATFQGFIPLPTYKSITFENGGETYVIGGVTRNVTSTNKVFKYNATSGWRDATNFVGLVDLNSAYQTINGSVFILDLKSNWWKFDPLNETMRKVSSFNRSTLPGGIMPYIEDELYFGLFKAESLFWRMEVLNTSDEFEYSLIPKNDFLGNKNHNTIASYQRDGRLFLLRASSAPNDPDIMTLWQFEPNEFQ